MPRAHPDSRVHRYTGLEFDWLGVDRQGQVAVFTTAGYGPIPGGVYQHLDEVDAAIDRVRELAVVGSACDLAGKPGEGNYSHWYALSARGFYAYDWSNVWDPPYQRLSSPTVPISISLLPAEVQAAAHLAEFPVSFADEAEITIEYLPPPAP